VERIGLLQETMQQLQLRAQGLRQERASLCARYEAACAEASAVATARSQPAGPSSTGPCPAPPPLSTALFQELPSARNPVASRHVVRTCQADVKGHVAFESVLEFRAATVARLGCRAEEICWAVHYTRYPELPPFTSPFVHNGTAGEG